MNTFTVPTRHRNEMIDITDSVRRAVAESGIREGLATVFVPHTTAGVTINENADPDVIHDILLTLEELIPHQCRGYRHSEGNSDAHVKSSLIGSSVMVIVREGRLELGTWQSIFFCEFDGPRRRTCMVHICAQ